MTFEPPPTVRYETRGRIAYLTIDRPQAMNALNREVMDGLSGAIYEFLADDHLLSASPRSGISLRAPVT